MEETHPADAQLLEAMRNAPQAGPSDGPRPLDRHVGVLNALAQLYQKCSEICSRVAQNEISSALAFYMMGMAHAHWLDAARARELAAPTVEVGPPVNFEGFIHAYEAVLALVKTTAFASNDNDNKGEAETVRVDLAERAAGL